MPEERLPRKKRKSSTGNMKVRKNKWKGGGKDGKLICREEYQSMEGVGGK